MNPIRMRNLKKIHRTNLTEKSPPRKEKAWKPSGCVGMTVHLVLLRRDVSLWNAILQEKMARGFHPYLLKQQDHRRYLKVNLGHVRRLSVCLLCKIKFAWTWYLSALTIYVLKALYLAPWIRALEVRPPQLSGSFDCITCPFPQDSVLIFGIWDWLAPV